MSENLVEVKHLQQYFPAGGMGKNKQYVQAVDDVSFAIRKGETLGLVGESGCGKTTTLRVIAGFVTPKSGNVFFDGKDIANMPPYKRPVNTVFQKYALFPHLNVFENVPLACA